MVVVVVVNVVVLQRLDVYQRAIEFLALVYDIVDACREVTPIVQTN